MWEGLWTGMVIGIQTTMDLMTRISKQANSITDPQQLKEVLKQETLPLSKQKRTRCCTG